MQHLTLDLYLRALRGEIPLAALVRQGHAHLLEICETCRNEWDGADGSLPLPEEAASHLRDVPESWLLTQGRIDAQEQRLAQRREAERLAREDLRRLLRLPVGDWARRVSNARTRFGSRGFARLLVEESRARVRSRPREAAALAALVPLALSWTVDRRDTPWAPPLLVRAAAHRANALRVAGDLTDAARLFRELRRRLERRPVADPALAAELDSLEASLAIDARKPVEAERLLAGAVETWSRLGDREEEARTRIQLANLMQTLGRAGGALDHFARAADLLEADGDPYLLACTVAGRVNSLCDLDRAAEAGHVLERHALLYTGSEDPYVHVLHVALLGRVALGSGHTEEAEERLTTARDRFLDLGRDYDAILNSLYLADALLAAGKMAELRSLAADLVPLFRSRGVAREALASLRLLTRAGVVEQVDATFLSRLRRKLEERMNTSEPRD